MMARHQAGLSRNQLTVRRRPSVNPTSMRLLRAPGGHRAEGDLLVVLQNGLEGETLEIEAKPEPFRVELEKTGSRHYKAHVSWSSEDPEAPVHGQVELRISLGSLEVPVQVVAQIASGHETAIPTTKK